LNIFQYFSLSLFLFFPILKIPAKWRGGKKHPGIVLILVLSSETQTSFHYREDEKILNIKIQTRFNFVQGILGIVF